MAIHEVFKRNMGFNRTNNGFLSMMPVGESVDFIVSLPRGDV